MNKLEKITAPRSVLWVSDSQTFFINRFVVVALSIILWCRERFNLFLPGPIHGVGLNSRIWKTERMRTDNPFDRKLDAWSREIPPGVRDAAVFVTDTLDLSWASVQAVFEDQATPELALAIYDRIEKRIVHGTTDSSELHD